MIVELKSILANTVLCCFLNNLMRTRIKILHLMSKYFKSHQEFQAGSVDLYPDFPISCVV